MGDLYEDQMVIEDVIQRLCDNKIIILPQTVYFFWERQIFIIR